MKVTINFYSNWAIGSGKGGDSKDSIILLDDDGLPFIPGKTLKGLIRDAYLECGYTNAIKLFGQEKNIDIETKDLKEGEIRFNSAHLHPDFKNLPKEVRSKLFSTKTSTRLDANKQATDNSLRKNEVTIPLQLSTTILVKKDNSELVGDDYNNIENALKMLKIMGEKRHRGLGRCLITTEKEENSNTANDANDSISNKTTVQKTIHFKCTVTEPLVLVKKAKTDQNIESLDYIPGNTFRGIVAGSIANGNKKEFNDIIFKNTVQFGDAHLFINGKPSLKTPFSFYYDKNKTDDDALYNFHKLKPKDWIDKKLKLQKMGYLIETENGIVIKKIKYGNRIKSTRNRAKRSSEKSGMFSYHYIAKGQNFEFEVSSKNTKYLNKIITILDGKTKYFGKSKSAEFGGAIKINFISETATSATETIQKGTYLYAKSNLCFLNQYGEFTTTPSAEQLTGDKNAVIDWEKSQVKFRTFSPYNFYRKNHDFERLIIEKGSVFVFKEEVDFSNIDLNGLGYFLTEGYGKVLVNPSFLKNPKVELFVKEEEKEEVPGQTEKKEPKEKQKPPLSKFELTNESNELIKFVKTKYNNDVDEINIDNLIKKYTNVYKQKVPSQWARVFNATTRAKNYTDLKLLLFNEGNNNANRDQSIFNGGLNKWNPKDVEQVKNFLKESDIENNEIYALRKLAKKMIAITKNKK